MRANKRTFSAAEIKPASELAPLNLPEIFGRIEPLEVDLGCGDGSFLVALAEMKPERDFLGVERMPARVRSACRQIGDQRLRNARVLPREILNAVQQFLPPASVDVFYLLFPDPWPKRRHSHRRVVTGIFLRAIARALKPGGELRLATDQLDYFHAIQSLLPEILSLTQSANNGVTLPLSTFEERFEERGQKIYRVVLRKISDPQKEAASHRSR